MAVYFLYAKKARRIKIGYSNNPKRRICSIQTASPENLILLAVLGGKRELEQAIHSHFHYLRDKGEWFRAEDELFEWIHTVRKKKHIPFVRLIANDKNLDKKEEHYKKLGYIIVHDFGEVKGEGLNVKRVSKHP